MDTIRLTKILMLTTSPADGESLAAIRKANALLKQSGLNWEQFLRVRLAGPEIREEPKKKKPAAKKLSRHDEEKLMLETCLEEVHGDARDFIEDIHDKWTRWGSLTKNQFNAIKKFYDRCRPAIEPEEEDEDEDYDDDDEYRCTCTDRNRDPDCLEHGG